MTDEINKSQAGSEAPRGGPEQESAEKFWYPFAYSVIENAYRLHRRVIIGDAAEQEARILARMITEREKMKPSPSPALGVQVEELVSAAERLSCHPEMSELVDVQKAAEKVRALGVLPSAEEEKP